MDRLGGILPVVLEDVVAIGERDVRHVRAVGVLRDEAVGADQE